MTLRTKDQEWPHVNKGKKTGIRILKKFIQRLFHVIQVKLVLGSTK